MKQEATAQKGYQSLLTTVKMGVAQRAQRARWPAICGRLPVAAQRRREA